MRFHCTAFPDEESNRAAERAGAIAYPMARRVLGPYLSPLSGRISRMSRSMQRQGFNAQYLAPRRGDIEMGAHLSGHFKDISRHMLHEVLHANIGSEFELTPRVWEGYLDVLTLAMACRPEWKAAQLEICEAQCEGNRGREKLAPRGAFHRMRWQGQQEAIRTVGVSSIIAWTRKRKAMLAGREGIAYRSR